MRLLTLKKKVIDFTNYNHTLVQLVCSVVDEFSIDERSFNLLKLELKHIKHYDFIGVDEFLSIFLGNTVNIIYGKINGKTLLILSRRILLNKN